MRIETICTGDELLTGLTSDTNSRFFQEALLDRTGLVVRRGVVVGDDAPDIIEALRTAAQRADIVLVSGGLGPTTDDLTAECAATCFGAPLELNEAALQHLEQRFRSRNILLTENNKRQALVPRGSEVVLNSEGSAPMFIMRHGQCVLYFVPGVPHEYRHLVGEFVVPRIAARLGPKPFRKLALLKTVGLPESHLDERVRPLAARFPQVTVGFRTHPPENHLKLMAEGPTEAEASTLLERAVDEASTLLGDTLFGRDAQSMASVVLDALRTRNHQLAVAESCTGGLVAELLTAVPGASEVFFGGVCPYQDDAKHLLAHVPEGLLAQFGAVSSECAEAMAQGMRDSTQVQWALSTTGFAGPGGGTEANPVGTVYLGLAGPHGTHVEKHRFHGDRLRVRSFASHAALDFLRRTLHRSYA